MEEKADKLARQMMEASKDTRLAVDSLRVSIEERRRSLDEELTSVRREISDLRSLLVGDKGDNGLSSRVMLLERTRAHISWQSVGVIIALALAAVSYLTGR